jgi:hypothetical protein
MPTIKEYEDRIARIDEQLDDLGSGRMRLRTQEGDGPWVDATNPLMRQLSRVKSFYEAIVAKLRRTATG